MGFHTNAASYWPLPNYPATRPAKYDVVEIADGDAKAPLIVDVGSVESSWSLTSSALSAPQLVLDTRDDESFIAPPTPTAPPCKQRDVVRLEFVDCSNEHPLNCVEPCAKSSNGAAAPTSAPERDCQLALVYQEVLFGEDKEMAVYDVRAQRLFGLPRRRTNRLNSDFLRQYVAERQMVDHGKIHYIPSSPILPPRHDFITSEPTEKVLGISYGWRKVRRQRNWRQLDAKDFLKA